MTRRALASAVLLAAAIFAADASAAPLVVHATFDTPTVEFGDPIRTHVVVSLDGTSVQPGSLRIVDDATPLTPLSQEQTTRTVQGRTTTVVVTRTFSCISSGCVSASGVATPALPAVAVTATTRSGSTLHATAAWPALHVSGRVSRADLARSQPPFRADTAPAPPSYRRAPSTLAWLLDGLAVALALAALALAAREGLRLARRRRFEPVADELERAVRLAREAEHRPPPDRRRALGLLARLLEARERRLSAAATELAWAKPEPEPEALAGLVSSVEREVPS